MSSDLLQELTKRDENISYSAVPAVEAWGALANIFADDQ